MIFNCTLLYTVEIQMLQDSSDQMSGRHTDVCLVHIAQTCKPRTNITKNFLPAGRRKSWNRKTKNSYFDRRSTGTHT